MKITVENKQSIRKYTYEELLSKQGSSVVGKAIKCSTDDILVVDLGNDLLGEIHITDFEDTNKETPKVALIAKIGQPVEAIVEAVYGDKVILNRARLQKEYKTNILDKEFKPGMVLDTEVYSIAPFGVFVELGKGVLALLPIDNIAVSRLTNMKDVFYKGKPIKVVYKGKLNGLYVVSHRELLGTWAENCADFNEGEIVQGIVRDVKSYGAFIEIAPNLSGLADLPDFPLSIGDSVSVYIKRFIPDKMKIKLHVINVTDIPYEIKYNYKIQDGTIRKWVYNPTSQTEGKKIETIF